MKDDKEIIQDLKDYFSDREVSGGRWSLEEVNLKLDRTCNAIRVDVVLLPNKKYKSLNDLR